MPPKRKPTEPTEPQNALALVRISDDPDERQVGVKRQEQDCRDLATRLGWNIGEVIVENDTSAYKTKVVKDERGRRRRVTLRPEFERALDLLNSGRNDGLIVYNTDRLARTFYDLERLIDIVSTGRAVVTSVTGSLDLSNDDGIAMARMNVTMANKSSADTARRVARAARARAETGAAKTDGFRPYGYDRDMTIVPEEAAVIIEVADRIMLGDPVRSIAADLNARGVKPMYADKWRNPAVKSIVRKPTVAGLRAYTPSNPSDAARHGTTYFEGTWEPILERQTWEILTELLENAGGTRTGSVRYLLSGIATCGACKAKLYVGTGHNGAKHYRCPECHKVTRSLAFVDGIVTEVVEGLLARDEVKAARARQSKRPMRSLVGLSALRERRRQILDSAGLFSPADIADMLKSVDDRIADLEERSAATFGAVTMPRAVEFADLALARQRMVVRALVTVEVLPAGRGRGLDPDGVRITEAY